MAQAGYTPIQIYYSTTTTNTPSAGNLVDGELAINTADGKLFYKDNLGVVKVLADASQTGTVSSVSVVSANGFAGTVATATSTPAITLTTTITGILQGNGTAISAASTTGSGAVVLATGAALVTPALGTPTSGDFSSGTFTWPTFNQNTTGQAGSVANSVTFNTTGGASAGTSFNGSVARTIDYSTVGAAPATTGSSILYANGSGGFSSVTIGSGLSFSTGTLTATGSGGTVTSVSVVSANGFGGTVATATTTPAITITTSVTGLLKGNGTSVSAAVSGTDYAPATSGTSILYGNGSGGFSSVTVGTGLSFSTGTLSNSAPMTYPSGSGIAIVSSGTSWGTTLTAPSGTIVGTTDTQTLTNKRITSRIVSITGAAGGTITPTSDTADQYNITALGATATFAAPSGTPTDGQKLSIRIYSAAAQTLSWTTTSTGYRVIGTTLPTTTGVGKTIYVGCVWNAADSFWDVVAIATQA